LNALVSGIAILFAIPMLILRVVWFFVSLSLRRRLTRPVFYVTLRREGLSHEEAMRLCEVYNLKIPLREMVVTNPRGKVTRVELE